MYRYDRRIAAREDHRPALISYPHPHAAFVPFLLRALANTPDELLSFESYGEYATSSTGGSSVSELLEALARLGPRAISALPELASMRTQPGRRSKRITAQLELTVTAITEDSRSNGHETTTCCNFADSMGRSWWTSRERKSTQTAELIPWPVPVSTMEWEGEFCSTCREEQQVACAGRRVRPGQ